VDHLARHPVIAFDHSQIRLVQHRKASPSLPTLMLEFKLDSAAERQRKRRSSRTSGLGSKDPWGNTLLFRDAPDEPHTIHDWNNKMQPCIAAADAPNSRDGAAPAKSPTSRSVTSFTNPFAQRESRPRPENPVHDQYLPSRPEGPPDCFDLPVAQPAVQAIRPLVPSKLPSPPGGLRHGAPPELPLHRPVRPSLAGLDLDVGLRLAVRRGLDVSARSVVRALLAYEREQQHRLGRAGRRLNPAGATRDHPGPGLPNAIHSRERAAPKQG
jgi:hypothetical protein